MFTLGLPVQAVARRSRSPTGRRSCRYVKGTAAESGIDRNIRYGKGGRRRLVRRREQLDGRASIATARTRITRPSCSPPAATTATTRGTRRSSRRDASAARSSTAELAEGLDYAGKRVVVIGSGATAVTLIPALADPGAGHVTMLQRSPTYIGCAARVDPFTVRTNKALPAKRAYVLNRWKSILFQSAQYRLSRRFPKFMRKVLMTMAERLPEGYDVQKHFGPGTTRGTRDCASRPTEISSRRIRAGRPTRHRHIERFTKTGIKLASGEVLQADIVVTATGLNLQRSAGRRSAQRRAIELTDTMAYKGMMLTHMPNMAFTIGYTNASWTLKADLVSEFVCRLLKHMDDNGFDTVDPEHPGTAVDEGPLIDFTPGYVLRAVE